MDLYDVAFTSHHANDAEAIAELAAAAGRADLAPRFSARAARTRAALEPLWSEDLGSYANMLTNGTRVPRWAPTVFYPLISGAVDRHRVPAMMRLLTDPTVFCVNATHAGAGGPDGVLLLNFGAPGAPAATSCASDACVVDAVLRNVGAGVRPQALVQRAGAQAAGLLNLTLFTAAAYGGASALTTAAAAPADAAFAPVRVEGACFAEASAAAPVPLTLWARAAAPPAFATCGGGDAACAAAARAAGLAPAAAPMCFAASVAAPADWPCLVPLPAIGRSDAAFGEQTYWRGRAWAPNAFLVWLGLQRYADVPEADAARRTLVDMSGRLFARQLENFGQVNENLDGLLGLGSDSNRADSYYHWGALWGFIGLVEAGGFPASVLVAPAPGA